MNMNQPFRTIQAISYRKRTMINNLEIRTTIQQIRRLQGISTHNIENKNT